MVVLERACMYQVDAIEDVVEMEVGMEVDDES